MVEKISDENISGGGGRAIARLIETADRQQNTLLISSTPIVVRSLQGIFPQSFRDLRVIKSVITDYTAILVRADSPYNDFKSLAASYKLKPRSVKIAGGSVRGSTDHFVVATGLFLCAGFLVLGKRRPVRLGLVTISLTGGFYFLMTMLEIHLPQGE